MEYAKLLPDIDIPLEKIDMIERAYDFEEEVLLSIRQGDVNRIRELYKNYESYESKLELISHMTHRLPKDQLRFQKNNTIILNSLCRVAAKIGGLPIMHLHLISEKYAIMIEAATSHEYLVSIMQPKLCIEYAKAVNMFSTRGYNCLIKDVINYITSNLSQDIRIAQIADYFKINPATLSRNFKKDTNMSITEYVNYQRIELAKFYFQKGVTNITEVSHRVGFNDSSYFTKVFKKVTGILPRTYINDMKK